MALTIQINTTFDLSGLQTGTAAFTTTVGRMAADVNASFKRMADQTGASAKAMQNSFVGLTDQAKLFGSNVLRSIGNAADFSKLSTGATAATQAFAQLNRTAANTTGILARLGTFSQSIAGGFAVVTALERALSAVVQTLSKLTRSFFENAIGMDQLRHSLTAVSGSAAAGTKEMQFLEAVAATSGTAILELGKHWVGLEAAARTVPGRFEEARKIFVALAETAPRLGKSSDQVGLALYGLTQLTGGATVQLDELQKQLGDQLPGIMPKLAAAMAGLQKPTAAVTQAFREQVAAGKVLVDDLLPHMAGAIRSLAAGDGPVATFRAELGRLQTAWTLLMDALANTGILTAVGIAVQGLTGAFNGLTAAVRFFNAQFTNIGQAAQVTNAMQNIQQQIQETEKSIKNLEQASTTGVGGVINRVLGLEQGPALEAQRTRLQELTSAYDSLNQSLKGLQQTESSSDVAPSASEKAAAQRLRDLEALKKTAAETKEAIGKLNLELEVLQGQNVAELLAIGLDPLTKDFEKERKGRIATILKERQELQDKLHGIDTKANARTAKDAAKVPIEQARAEEEVLEASLKKRLELTKQHFDEQRQASDDALAERLQREPAAYAEIQQKARDVRKTIAAEEAKDLERIAIEGEQLKLQATLRRLDAQQAAEKKAGASEKLKTDRIEAEADTAAKIEAIRTKTAQVTQGLSKKTFEEAAKDAKALIKIQEDTAEAQLSARGDLIDAEKSLITAQVEGEVITKAEGMRQIRALHEKEFEIEKERLTLQANNRIADIIREIEDHKLRAAEIQKVREGLNSDIRKLGVEQATETQRLLNEQTESWRHFAEQVQDLIGDFFFKLFSGQIDSVKELLLDFRNFFLRILADMAAQALARPIIMTIVGAVGGVLTGSGGGGLLGGGGGLLGTAGTVGQVAGAANQLGLLGNLTSGLRNAFSGVVGALDSAALHIGRWAIETFGIPVGPGGFQVSGLGALAGLAGIGGGLFTALTSKNIGGQIGGGIGAAAGGVALASSLGLIAIPGLQPLALAIAALAPILGNFLGGLGARKGPRLGIGELGGLGIGLGPSGGLDVTGELTSRILRAERIGGEQDIQAALEDSVSKSITSMVDVINAIAVDPSALLGPAQAALNQALKDALVVNSSSRKNFQADIEAQLKFIPLQIASHFLDPLGDAFDQLGGEDLRTQVAAMPAAAAQMVAVIQDFNKTIEELQSSANEDVKGRLPEVRRRLAEFQGRFVDTMLGAIEQAFARPENFRQAVVLAATLPKEATDLDPRLKAFADAARLVAPVLANLVQSIEAINAVITPTPEKLREVQERMGELREELGDVGSNLAAALPLFEQLRQAIVLEGELRLQQLKELLDAVLAGEDMSTSIGRLIKAFKEAVDQLDREIEAIENEIATAERGFRARERVLQAEEFAIRLEERGLRQIEKQINAEAKLLDAEEKLLDGVEKQLNGVEKQLNAESKLLEAEEKRLVAQERVIDAQEKVLQGHREQLDVLQEELRVRTEARDTIQQEVEQLASLSDRIKGLVRTGESPLRAAESLRGEIGIRQARLGTQTGEERLQTLDELVALNEELVNLGRSTNQLDLQKEGIDNLRVLQTQVDSQRSVAEQQLAVAEQLLVATQAQVDHLQAFITSFEANIARQREDLQANRDRLEARQDALEAKHDALEARRDALQERRDALQERRDALQERRDALQERRDALQERRDAIEDARFQIEYERFLLEGKREELERKREQRAEKQEALDRLRQAAEDEYKRAVKDIQIETKKKLEDLERELQNIFRANVEIAKVLGAPASAPLKTAASVSPIPLPVTIQALTPGQVAGGMVQGFKWGGPLMPMQPADLLPMQRFQFGGRAILAEPGEMVFGGPLSQQTATALETVNRTFPRFQVGGTGDGDTVPLVVPEGSFILNRRAARAVRGGFQGGGQVTTEQKTITVNITVPITLNATITQEMDVRDVVHKIERHLKGRLVAEMKKTPLFGR